MTLDLGVFISSGIKGIEKRDNQQVKPDDCE